VPSQKREKKARMEIDGEWSEKKSEQFKPDEKFIKSKPKNIEIKMK